MTALSLDRKVIYSDFINLYCQLKLGSIMLRFNGAICTKPKPDTTTPTSAYIVEDTQKGTCLLGAIEVLLDTAT